DALDILEGLDSVGVVRFTDRDVVRHGLVSRIVRAYDAHDRRNSKAAADAAQQGKSA
ncbi:MAG: PhoH family protein, partial [Telmatospirillum sp.]|nr:PhoH family protein [Telmatospirillum sp.]